MSKLPYVTTKYAGIFETPYPTFDASEYLHNPP